VKDETLTLAKALRAFKESRKEPTTAEIGLRLGISEDYNKSDIDLIDDNDNKQYSPALRGFLLPTKLQHLHTGLIL
jgi:hypothetical protein